VERTPHKSYWAWSIATFFGAGFLRPGPGTYASAITVILWMTAGRALYDNMLHLTAATIVALAAVVALGIPAATRVAHESGRKDPSFVVIDEVAGQLIPLIGVTPEWPHALFALLLFRFFDILKPWPIRRLESLPEGTGIVVDDLAAGLYAAIAIQIVLRLVPHHQ
jgi:phosphatidylglycerophosphatase A